MLGPFSLDSIYLEDCRVALSKLPDRCVDLVIADPPYNLSSGGQWSWTASQNLPGFGGPWQKVMADWDRMDLADYLTFTLTWLSEIKRILKATGSIWVHGTYHNSGIINCALQILGIEIINEIVWYKRNSFPNLSGRRLTASHETILWAHVGPGRHYHFDYSEARNGQWPDDLLKKPGKQMRTVWDIPNNKNAAELAHGRHPTQKPLRLIQRILRLSAKPGGICLVPFAGSGSECVAARDAGLRYLGFEIEPAYLKIAEKRLGTRHRALAKEAR